ncbi:MAG TPA: archease [Candidatus Udaeobacter sp.]|nr:archease [Candidatus Udaeobacter sp.]
MARRSGGESSHANGLGAERFAHGSDVGIRGVGPSREAAFEQAALALTGIVTGPARVRPERAISVECEAPDDGLLLVDWLNALIYRMATDKMLFGRFAVSIDDHRLKARAWGEPVDRTRHHPAVEPKGATYTALEVAPNKAGLWVAQCVIDV